jgi:hypothetical protein
MAAPTAQQIRTEIDADPKALGYATLKVQTNGPEAVAARMNEVGASAETLFRSYVPMEDFLAEIVASEFTALSAAAKTGVDQFFRGTRIKTGSANMRATLSGLFPSGATRTALIALASRPCSRAEALWGEGATVSATQVANALAL